MNGRTRSLLLPLLLIPLLLITIIASSSMISPVLSQAQETDIFRDDFESYGVGTFPSAGGWEIVWDGMGAKYQVISTSYSYSPTKSFQLWGRYYWTAVVQRKFSTDAPVIGYELSILIEGRGSEHGDHPAFFCREAAQWGAYYGTVFFDHSDGKIKAEDGRVLGTWSPKTWYRVKVILDRQTNRYSVWINGELRGKDIPTSRSDTNKINAIALVAGWHEKKVYYDDVRVFVVYALSVRLDSITLNGQTLSTSNPELRVAPGSRITGTVTFTVENVQPGSWITPVIWVTSWERGSVADGKVRVVSKTIWSTQQFTVKIDVTAPQKPGTYYIGFFAGWMYSPDEVASNDHPPEYGNGNDIWDMKQSDWESILRDGRAPEGAVYGWPGRAIRVVVEEPSPQPQRGSLIVKVIDANFAPVPNAEVKLYKWGEGFMLSARTDSSGEVTFSDLEPGFYAVTYVPSTPWELRRVDGSYVGVLEIVGLAPNGDFLVEVKPGENVRWVVKEAVLTVSVKDQEGKPIRDVEVSLYSCVSNGEKLFLTGSTQKTGGSGLVFYRWLSPNFEYLPKYIVVVKTPDVEKSAEVTLTGWEEPAGIKKVEIVLSSKPAPSTPVIPGDMNRNGVLDTGDATILLRKVVGLEPTTPEDITIGDLNGNGVLDTGDATRILRMVVGLE